MRFDNVASSEIINLVNEYVHNAEHRQMLIDRFVDGMTFSALADKYHYSERYIKKIVYKHGDKLLQKLQ